MKLMAGKTNSPNIKKYKIKVYEKKTLKQTRQYTQNIFQDLFGLCTWHNNFCFIWLPAGKFKIYLKLWIWSLSTRYSPEIVKLRIRRTETETIYSIGFKLTNKGLLLNRAIVCVLCFYNQVPFTRLLFNAVILWKNGYRHYFFHY